MRVPMAMPVKESENERNLADVVLGQTIGPRQEKRSSYGPPPPPPEATVKAGAGGISGHVSGAFSSTTGEHAAAGSKTRGLGYENNDEDTLRISGELREVVSLSSKN